MKPKLNRAGDTSQAGAAGYDCCQTPPYALEPLLPYLQRDQVVWEPAAGEGLLATSLDLAGYRTVRSDIQTGQDFFSYSPSEPWDVLITNPPYSMKYRWIARCYELGKPWALLVPLETLGAGRDAQPYFKKYGVEVMLLSRRVNFKMPAKGWDGSSAQFPVIWLSWRVTRQPLTFGEITPPRKVRPVVQLDLPEEAA
jgi:hypothetical protein